MFLRRIILFGFKSFAHKSVIDFNPGLQVIVGPNGCGKSNIIDAIQWVCGEQALKHLRVNRSEDIIFGGTSDHKPLNVAEVTVVFDNEAGIFPLDSNELRVSRRLYRSGENSYFINEQEVRLKDLRDMLGHASLGKSMYSILEQGSVDKVLVSKPEERRGIFEDAAGISRYRLHATEILQRIRAAEEKIAKAEYIHANNSKNLERLAVQHKKMERYRKLKQELFVQEQDLELLRIRDLETISGNATETVRKISESCKELEEKIHQSDELYKRIEEETKEFHTHTENLRHEISEQRVAEGRLDEQVSMLGRQLEEQRKQLETTAMQCEQEQIHVRQMLLHVEELKSLRKNNLDREQKLWTEMQAVSTEIAACKTRITEQKKKQEDCRTSIQENDMQRAALQKELTELAEELAMFVDRALQEYSHQQRLNFEQEIDLLLEKLQKFCNTNQISATHIPDIVVLIETLGNAIASHRETIPVFLTQLTSPGGTITRKREIDSLQEEIHMAVLLRQEELKNLEIELEKLVTNQIEKETVLFDLQKEQVRISSELQQQQVAIARGEEDYTRALERCNETEERVRSIHIQIEKQEKQIQTLNLVRSTEEKRIHSLLDKSRAIHMKIDKNKNLIGRTRQNRQRHQQELEQQRRKSEQVRISLAEVQGKISSIHEYFRQKHGLELSDHRKKAIRRNKDRIQEAIDGIKQSISELGAVNFMASEEHAELAEQIAFMESQLKDLYQARKNFHSIEQDLHKKTVTKFLKCFEEVRKHFQTVFTTLFPGGKCDLCLESPEKVLESGIEIYAQPKGKKLKSITQLSGGERSMTAIALLFAIYMYRPAPFTCFDEVDAMLDSNNTLLFSNMLKELSRSSQFIVVTHNERTSTCADAIVGITMQTPGISSVLSARLDVNSDSSIA